MRTPSRCRHRRARELGHGTHAYGSVLVLSGRLRMASPHRSGMPPPAPIPPPVMEGAAGAQRLRRSGSRCRSHLRTPSASNTAASAKHSGGPGMHSGQPAAGTTNSGANVFTPSAYRKLWHHRQRGSARRLTSTRGMAVARVEVRFRRRPYTRSRVGRARALRRRCAHFRSQHRAESACNEDHLHGAATLRITTSRLGSGCRSPADSPR